MLGEVEPSFSLCRTRPESLDQILEIVLESTHAPDLPPHLPAGRWESRHVIGPERFEARLANGLDGFDETLAPRFALGGQFAFLVFTENVEEHLARFIGNVESDDTNVGLFTPASVAAPGVIPSRFRSMVSIRVLRFSSTSRKAPSGDSIRSSSRRAASNAR